LPAVLNAANEVAVEAFLSRYLNFSLIPEIVTRVMEAHQVIFKPGLEEIITADQWAREKAQTLISKFEV
jgi:1-deoxy-D-xylulose-5-phosphate reductoisomerase